MESRLLVMVQRCFQGDAVQGADVVVQAPHRGAKGRALVQARRPARLPQLLRRRAMAAARSRNLVGQLSSTVQIGTGPRASMSGQVGRVLGSLFQRTNARLNGPIVTRLTGR